MKCKILYEIVKDEDTAELWNKLPEKVKDVFIATVKSLENHIN